MNKCKIINDLKDLSNDICPISKLNLRNEKFKNNIIMLNCKHCFFYPDFMQSYFINNTNFYSYKKCPYCFSNIENIPFIINKTLKK